jgi:hypothetical protein
MAERVVGCVVCVCVCVCQLEGERGWGEMRCKIFMKALHTATSVVSLLVDYHVRRYRSYDLRLVVGVGDVKD